MSIKLKDLLKENYSGTVLGGVVSGTGFHDNISLSKIVKEKYGDSDGEKVDVNGLIALPFVVTPSIVVFIIGLFTSP